MSLSFGLFDVSNELDRQRELFLKCFPENIGETAGGKEHYHWKFHRFPNVPPSYEYVAKEGEAIVGYYAAIPYPYVINGEMRTAAMVCDVMTHPEMQGRGIFTKLGAFATDKFKESGLDFTTGYPVRHKVIPGHIKVGWKIVFDLPVYACPLHSKSILSTKGLGFLSPFVDAGISLFHGVLKACRKKVSSDLKVIHFQKSELEAISGYDAFFASWVKTQKNVLWKSKEFLSWRLGAPHQEYTLTCVYKEHALLGVAISKQTLLQGVPSLAILDVMLLEPEGEVAILLFESLHRLGKKQQVSVVAGMFSAHWAKKYNLKQHGFLFKPATFKLIIKPLSASVKEETLFQEKNWHLMWIDSDDL